jgi:hypothetical protein
VSTLGAVLLDESLRTSGAAGPPGLVGRGLLPLSLLLLACVGYGLLLRFTFRASRTELLQSMFTLLVTAFAVLTLVGVWFRGSGMQLG